MVELKEEEIKVEEVLEVIKEDNMNEDAELLKESIKETFDTVRDQYEEYQKEIETAQDKFNKEVEHVIEEANKEGISIDKSDIEALTKGDFSGIFSKTYDKALLNIMEIEPAYINVLYNTSDVEEIKSDIDFKKDGIFYTIKPELLKEELTLKHMDANGQIVEWTLNVIDIEKLIHKMQSNADSFKNVGDAIGGIIEMIQSLSDKYTKKFMSEKLSRANVTAYEELCDLVEFDKLWNQDLNFKKQLGFLSSSLTKKLNKVSPNMGTSFMYILDEYCYMIATNAGENMVYKLKYILLKLIERAIKDNKRRIYVLPFFNYLELIIHHVNNSKEEKEDVDQNKVENNVILNDNDPMLGFTLHVMKKVYGEE